MRDPRLRTYWEPFTFPISVATDLSVTAAGRAEPLRLAEASRARAEDHRHVQDPSTAGIPQEVARSCWGKTIASRTL